MGSSGNDTVVVTREPSDREIGLAIVGGVGSVGVQIAQQYFNRPHTTTTERDKLVAVVFAAPVEADWLPHIFDRYGQVASRLPVVP